MPLPASRRALLCAALGIEPVGNTPEQFAQQIRADLARWEKVVKQAGIKVD